MRVWEIQRIQPKASPEAKDIPNNASEARTAIGYKPTPPLVVVIAKDPAMNAMRSSDRFK
jgi:hypothetical protein